MKLFIRADGLLTEGIGAIAQYQIHTYNLSKLLGVEFASTEFANLQHYQGYGTQEEFGKDITKFFNFPNKIDLTDKNVVLFERIDQKFLDFVDKNKNEKDLFVEIKEYDLMKFADSNYLNWNQYINDLSSRIVFDNSKYYFDDDKLNVSLHIRNFIEGKDNDYNNPSRELCSKGDQKEKYYIKLLQKFDKIFNEDNNTKSLEKEYHIYSRSQIPGDLSEFESFTKLGLPIKFHIDEHPLVSLYHLIRSDVKALSNSSFSYISSLYGNGLSIVRDSFYHKIPENIIYSDYDGNFDESLISFEE